MVTEYMLMIEQIEYLVVTYEDSNPKVTLSLRQADILRALAHDEELCSNGGCVPALQDVNNTGYGLRRWSGQR